MENAAVFPLPVNAWTTMLLLSNAGCIAAIYTGVGFS